jgi:hypothetical protein
MTSAVFAKLNLKDQKEIVVLNAPASFNPELTKLGGVKVRTKLTGEPVSFAIAFVMRQPEVDSIAKSVAKLADGDAIIWFAYPKGSSRRYKSEISRDTGWRALGAAGFEGVRMVAIDEEWSAVRFRRVEFIKTMKRDVSGAMTKAGKARTSRAARS